MFSLKNGGRAHHNGFFAKIFFGKIAESIFGVGCRLREMQDEAMDTRMDYINIEKSEAV